MNKVSCRCVSSNEPEEGQSDLPILLQPPGDMPPVPIDYCIADAIKKLWASGIWTQGSCCGHGKTNPSVVLAHHFDGGKAAEVLKADGRDWDVMAWVLAWVAKTGAR